MKLEDFGIQDIDPSERELSVWPNGNILTEADEAELVACVREAFTQSVTPSVYESREQLDLANSLSRALVESGVDKTIFDASFEHFSIVFLAGVAWAKRQRS